MGRSGTEESLGVLFTAKEKVMRNEAEKTSQELKSKPEGKNRLSYMKLICRTLL